LKGSDNGKTFVEKIAPLRGKPQVKNLAANASFGQQKQLNQGPI